METLSIRSLVKTMVINQMAINERVMYESIFWKHVTRTSSKNKQAEEVLFFIEAKTYAHNM